MIPQVARGWNCLHLAVKFLDVQDWFTLRLAPLWLLLILIGINLFRLLPCTLLLMALLALYVYIKCFLYMLCSLDFNFLLFIKVPITGTAPLHQASMTGHLVGDKFFLWGATKDGQMHVLQVNNMVWYIYSSTLPNTPFDLLLNDAKFLSLTQAIGRRDKGI